VHVGLGLSFCFTKFKHQSAESIELKIGPVGPLLC